MNDSTIQSLNELNHRFYQAFAKDFDDTRHAPWPGWLRLLPHLDAVKPETEVFQVTDVACGNGRFYKFLEKHWSKKFEYLGIDSCVGLLEKAPQIDSVRFEERDVLTQGLPELECTFIGAFGFFHHIPSFERRRKVVEEMLAALQPGGVMAIAFWAFATSPRFESKTLEWPEELEREPGDYILSWNRGGLGRRYCHYVDEAEENKLLQGLDITIRERFFEDGKSRDLNRYLIVQKN